ncbi:serine/threonine protein kinase [Streptomyces sp. NPDC056361]|uniref:serine/threonine protein kinase n=1 Tax=Streptomyces sp. NPDC056361 TaxID=3345795 RepID=UPI0035DEC7EE
MNRVRPGGRVQPARPGDPAQVGPYRIVGRLGSGGMGTVHAGLDRTGLRVAVKIVHPAHAEDPEFRARFRREVQLSARVQGPCLIPMLAADPEADTPWLATAYTPGPTLDQHLTAHGPLSGSSLHAFASGTAQALADIHAAGIVHRDVKPQNVILTPAGPRMLDFGIAHSVDGTSVTRTGVMTGTPGWISPEHYRTGTAGPEGDVFAWGALVAYAGTGRLPFGAGAPDAVAYRVMSEEPDLRGLPDELHELVARAVAKEPSDRPAASDAVGECVALLSAQTTQVVSPGSNPTLISDLVATQWHIPVPDDPAWPRPAARFHRRAVTAAATAVAVAVIGSLAVYAATPDQGSTDLGRKAPASTPTPSGEASGESAPAATATTDPAAPMASRPAADPRTVRVPTDPLVGVPHPAYSRAGDETQPHPDEWRTSTTPGSPEEQDAAQAIRDHMTSMLATKDMDFMRPTVTFNLRAQTLIVTGGPVPQLPDDYQEVFREAGRMAACTALAHRLKDKPTTWPYGRFSIHWKTSDVEAPAIGFGEATDGCFGEIAGQWHGDEAGMATAGFPSSDKAEIRVADAAVKAITARWNADTARTNADPIGPGDGISLGFDPVENAAYVWTDDPNSRFTSRASQSTLAGTVEASLCRSLMEEFHRNRSWNYTRWAVAVYDEYTGTRQFVDSGTCTT